MENINLTDTEFIYGLIGMGIIGLCWVVILSLKLWNECKKGQKLCSKTYGSKIKPSK